MTVLAAKQYILGWTLVAVVLGCANTTHAPMGSFTMPKSESPKILPTEEDLAAVELAEFAIVGDRLGADRALQQLRSSTEQHQDSDMKDSGLIPYAVETRISMNGDEIIFREQVRKILKEHNLHPSQQRRLEYELSRDPLEQANRHLDDSMVRKIGSITNSLIDPVGRSLLSGSLLPMRLIQGLVRVSVNEIQQDRLTADERQALANWKRFVELHPEDPRALELLARIEDKQIDWYKTQRNINLRLAKRAVARGQPTVAVAYAERTLRYSPEDGEALSIQREAEALMVQNKHDRNRSLLAPDFEDKSLRSNFVNGKSLAVAVLLDGDIKAECDHLLQNSPDDNLRDEIDFILSISAFRSEKETESWKILKNIGGLNDLNSNMARHAAALWSSPSQNPYEAFRLSLKSQRAEQARWLLFGPLKEGARDRDLPRALEWAIEIPTVPQVVTSFPSRLIRFPWARPKRRSPPVFARNYLSRHPNGERSEEIRDWLEDYEIQKGNYVGALRIAEKDKDADGSHIDNLREKAATQALVSSNKQRDSSLRIAMLRRTAREFTGTVSGHEAGIALREEVSKVTPQNIRVSRAFLYDSPEIVGPNGLGILPAYFDHQKRNGEIHKDGITFVGGLNVDVAFLGKSGRDEDDPVVRRQQVSKERLARTVAMIEEAARRTELTDPDYSIPPDPDRDLFFERARLGLTSVPDRRPEAYSGYTFDSPRERYGIVRGREALLPVELVLHGSLEDFGLGAFPRVKLPKADPDEALYR